MYPDLSIPDDIANFSIDEYLRTALEESTPVLGDVSTESVPSSVQAASKQARTRRTPKQSRPKAPATRGVNGFRPEDSACLAKFMEAYQETHRLTKEQLVERIWASERKSRDDFWNQVHLVLPSRTRAAVIKHCRRQFHVHGRRGVWTKDEDSALQAAVEKHGKCWKKVGAEIDRRPDDARDRYRNYISVPAHKTGRWTAEENRLLQQAMLDCEMEGRAEHHRTTGLSDEGIDAKVFLNADIIAAKMGHVRTRLQVQDQMSRLRKQARQESGNAGGGLVP